MWVKEGGVLLRPLLLVGCGISIGLGAAYGLVLYLGLLAFDWRWGLGLLLVCVGALLGYVKSDVSSSAPETEAEPGAEGLPLSSTERRSELEASDRVFESRFLSIPEALVCVSSGGRIQYMNGLAERYCRCGEGQGEGQSLDALWPTALQEEPVALFELCQTLLKGSHEADLPDDLTLTRGDGRKMLLAGTVSTVRHDEGLVQGYLLLLRDVTQLRAQMRQALWVLQALTATQQVPWLLLQAELLAVHEAAGEWPQGGSLQAWAGQSLHGVLDVADVALWQQALAQPEQPWVWSYQQRQWRVSLLAVPVSPQQPVSVYLCWLTEVTELTQLQQAEQQLTAVLQQLPVQYQVDQGETQRWANHSADWPPTAEAQRLWQPRVLQGQCVDQLQVTQSCETVADDLWLQWRWPVSPMTKPLPQELAKALQAGLARGEYELLYWPYYQSQQRQYEGCEAILVWQSESYGHVAGDELEQLLATTGGLAEVVQWRWRRVLQQLAGWGQGWLNGPVTLRLTRLELYDPELPAQLAQWLAESGVVAEQLVLLVDAAECRYGEALKQAMQRYTELGLALYLHDWSPRLLPVAELAQWPVAELAQWPVAELAQWPLAGVVVSAGLFSWQRDEPVAAAELAALLKLCQRQGWRVIAQELASKDQVQWLQRAGCHTFIGQAFARMMTAEALRARLVKAQGDEE